MSASSADVLKASACRSAAAAAAAAAAARARAAMPAGLGTYTAAGASTPSSSPIGKLQRAELPRMARAAASYALAASSAVSNVPNHLALIGGQTLFVHGHRASRAIDVAGGGTRDGA